MVTEGSGSSLLFPIYRHQQVSCMGTMGLKRREPFIQKDLSQHRTSIQLANLQVSNTATYQCQVRKKTLSTREVTITAQTGTGAQSGKASASPLFGHLQPQSSSSSQPTS